MIPSSRVITAIIYFYRISDVRLTGGNARSMSKFKDLCNPYFVDRTFLATTGWTDVKDETEKKANERERRLRDEDKFWGSMIKQGSQLMRIPSLPGEARDLITTISSCFSTAELATPGQPHLLVLPSTSGFTHGSSDSVRGLNASSNYHLSDISVAKPVQRSGSLRSGETTSVRAAGGDEFQGPTGYIRSTWSKQEYKTMESDSSETTQSDRYDSGDIKSVRATIGREFKNATPLDDASPWRAQSRYDEGIQNDPPPPYSVSIQDSEERIREIVERRDKNVVFAERIQQVSAIYMPFSATHDFDAKGPLYVMCNNCMCGIGDETYYGKFTTSFPRCRSSC
jgi:hypothetical protein